LLKIFRPVSRWFESKRAAKWSKMSADGHRMSTAAPHTFFRYFTVGFFGWKVRLRAIDFGRKIKTIFKIKFPPILSQVSKMATRDEDTSFWWAE
jgi:hypothetical protein